MSEPKTQLEVSKRHLPVQKSSETGSKFIPIHTRIQEAKATVKIEDCTEAEVKAALKYIILLLGLPEKDIPDDLEKAIIVDFIFSEYGHKYTPEEMKLAFRLALSGAITNVDSEIYGKRFSANYIARFMRAYDEFKRASEPSIVVPKDPEPEMSEAERKVKFCIQSIELLEAFEKMTVESGSVPAIFPIKELHYALVYQKKLPEADNRISDFYRSAATASLQKELTDMKLRNFSSTEIRQFMRTINDSETIEERMRKIRINDYLTSLLPKKS